MTKDLANLDQCIEARAFLANQINEYQKIVNHTQDPFAIEMLSRLQKMSSELESEIARLKQTK